MSLLLVSKKKPTPFYYFLSALQESFSEVFEISNVQKIQGQGTV